MWGIIVSFIYSLIGPLVAYVVKALGFGIVSFVGLTIVFDQVESHVNSKMAGIPADMLAFANLMGFDSAVKIILSTLAACVSYKAMIGATGTVWKKPGTKPGYIKEM
ncbi:MAG: DUF2523 domain-containing protein [Oceanospirillales bacterium]|nr:DUF2523 domain-containing protein [Oceanospirillales bacterium]